MPALNLTKQTVINLCLLVAVLLCTSHQLTAQINIGGINIPKPKRSGKPNTGQPEGTTSNTTNNGTPDGNSAAPQGDAQTNPNAPSDYNANLNVGDQAVAVDRFRDVKAVRIVGKSGAAYKVAELKSPDSVQWYSANSVYPYFDYQAFTEIMYDDKRFVTPYLPCYRYKTMKVYFRDPNDDHPYCRVVSARVKQDYAGGGRYNAEVYRSSVSEELFGCP
jgi:hypothetical protein